MVIYHAGMEIKYLQPLYRDVKFIAAGGNTRTFMEVLKNAFKDGFAFRILTKYL